METWIMFQKIRRQFTHSLSRRKARQFSSPLAVLPNKFMEPLWLQVVERYSPQDIAECLGISTEDVSRRLRCARAVVYGVAID